MEDKPTAVFVFSIPLNLLKIQTVQLTICLFKIIDHFDILYIENRLEKRV